VATEPKNKTMHKVLKELDAFLQQSCSLPAAAHVTTSPQNCAHTLEQYPDDDKQIENAYLIYQAYPWWKRLWYWIWDTDGIRFTIKIGSLWQEFNSLLEKLSRAWNKEQGARPLTEKI
jgi:hypothetical protein